MALLKLVIAPNPILQKESIAVEKITQETKQLCYNMLETMYFHHGIGLSAVQVGILQRVIVVDVVQSDKSISNSGVNVNQYIMINPEIIDEIDSNKYNEGCLSFPDQFVEITRPKEITVKYLDLNSKEQIITANGLFATCIQHEIDHLNGKTIGSYVSDLKRTMMLSKIKKIKRTMKNVI